MSKHATWYSKNSSADQGIVIDELTGRTIAVSYRTEDAALIAAAPGLLEALETLLIRSARLDQSANHDGLVNCDAIAAARAAVSKAKGE